MASPIKAVRGTRDLLPTETELWNHVENTARAVFERYGFGEIRTPVFEDTSLFARGVGEETDIVSKEMYTWEDRARLVQQLMKDAWLEKHRRYVTLDTVVSMSGDFTADLCVVEEKTGVREYIVFREKADLSTLNRLSELALSDSGSISRGRLVVCEDGVPLSLTEYAQDLSERTINPTPSPDEMRAVIEALAGNFYASSQSLTLRPENTAGVVRAYIEHKLGDTGNLQKLFYIGPMFRRERPQRGRYRQFWQIGAEVIGPASSGAESAIRDAEVLEMLASLLDELGITGWTLSVNSVGSSTDRPRYVAALREALLPIKDRLSPDNQRRAETNPLRVLDSKDEGDQELIDALPKIADFLDAESTEHFRQVLSALDACGVPYTVNPRLVRGLDYYTRTTFEFSHSVGLGSQNALLGGGRYDGLSEMLGGPRAPGIGFAIGEDRLILTLQAQAEAAGTAAPAKGLDAYVAPIGAESGAPALARAKALRRAGLRVEMGEPAFKAKKHFDVAERLGARCILFIGETEIREKTWSMKYLGSGVASVQSFDSEERLVQAIRSQETA